MRHQRGFSLKEEALQTSRTRSHWSSESRLRGNPVVFTSSGAENPLQDVQQAAPTTKTTSSGMSGPEAPRPPPADPQSTHESHSDASPGSSALCHRPDSARDISDAPCEPETPLPLREPEDKERPSSRASSCASDEVVILFTGRNNVRAKSDVPQAPVSEEMRVLESLERHTVMETSQSALPLSGDGPLSGSKNEGNQSSDGAEDGGAEEDEGNAGDGDAGDDEGAENDDGPGDDGGDGDISDYLANLLASGEHLMAEQFSLRDLGDSDDDIYMSGYISYDSDTDFGPAVNWSTSRKKKRGGKHAKSLQSRQKGSTPPKPHDLFTRYPSGMTKDQVVEELQRFLLSSDEQLTFPPLTKVFRKMLHEMANNLRLKSKSVGKGDTRRPVLYRTKATPVFDTGSFAAVTSKITRRYWAPRSGKAGAKRQKAGGAGFTGYKDGEVVGSGVPELGAENRGRAMLEKMGWSTGMALGTMNTGILQPVSQVVKRSKAGLGQE